MKQELFLYAVSCKERSNNYIPTACFIVILAIFSAPIIKLNLIFWAVLTVLYTLIQLYNSKKIKQQYMKTLFQLGAFMGFLGIEIAYLFVTIYPVIIELIICTIVMIFSYEVGFWIKIKLKQYSNPRREKKIINIITILCGTSGFWLGKVVNILFEDTPLVVGGSVILSALIIVGSFTYFRNFAICKTINP